MAEDIQEWLARTHREAVQRYSYFLLAAAGAAIGLVVNETQTAGLSLSQIPLGFAVVSWCLSFLFGCLHNGQHQEALWQNMWLLEAKVGSHPLLGDPLVRSAAVKDTDEKFSHAAKLMKVHGRRQFWLLIIGALLYLAWHIWQMYLRAHSDRCDA